MRIGIVIVAAGRGGRAGTSLEGPKQYRRIGGRAVIARTLDIFLAWPDSGPVVAVIHPDDTQLFQNATRAVAGIEGVVTTFGGTTRQQSVLAGLKALAKTDATHVIDRKDTGPNSSQ